jgi:hypothetical protein
VDLKTGSSVNPPRKIGRRSTDFQLAARNWKLQGTGGPRWQLKARRIKTRIAELKSRSWKLSHAGFLQNPRIVIAIKLMVKSKNLFMPEDGLGTCLEDANITQHLSLHGEF